MIVQLGALLDGRRRCCVSNSAIKERVDLNVQAKGRRSKSYVGKETP
jgi:hypothetical protein